MGWLRKRWDDNEQDCNRRRKIDQCVLQSIKNGQDLQRERPKMKPENELAMIVAFYLSKFGEEGLKTLGFRSYTQAFDQVGERLSVNRNSVKNWRDEFDPYYDNRRKGWNRKLRPSRHKVMVAFDDLSESALRAVVLDILTPAARPKVEAELHSALQEIKESEIARKARRTVDYVARGPTGRLAEGYFMARFRAGLTPFSGTLLDRRDEGVGFDFSAMRGSDHVLIEIKGIAKQPAGISLTDKEWRVANETLDGYFLGVVIDVIESPKIGFLQNPAQHLSPTYHAYTTIAVNWAVNARQIDVIEFS